MDNSRNSERTSTTLSSSDPVLSYAVSLLDDLLSFLERTDDVSYRTATLLAGTSASSSIGGHVRHLLEHFTGFLEGEARGWIDYDRRPRDPHLESSRDLACQVIVEIRQQLVARFRNGRLADSVRLKGSMGAGGVCRFEVGSTAGRELHYVAFHALHHMALLKWLGAQYAIAVSADFGKAPATIAFESGGGA